MKTSEQLDKISPAILRAQAKIGAAIKGSKNPFFKSNYADLGSVMEAVKDAHNEEGIAILQPLGSDEKGSYVETILLHESGQYISDKTRVPDGKNMQDFGASSTYARRFGLQSMTFTPAEDDDGESSVGRGKSKPTFDKAVSNAVKALETVSQVQPPASNVANAEPKKSTFKKPSAPVVTEPVSDDGGWQ